MYSIYLCGSIANAHINKTIAALLEGAGFDVFDPCLIVPQHCGKIDFPESVYSQCKLAIERSDSIFVFLDSLGKDSAWEVGFARGLNKCIVGVVLGSSLFLEDWMVKHALDHIVVVQNSWLTATLDSTEWTTVRGLCEILAIDNIPTFLANAITNKRQLEMPG